MEKAIKKQLPGLKKS